jgi:hypothetical protein
MRFMRFMKFMKFMKFMEFMEFMKSRVEEGQDQKGLRAAHARRIGDRTTLTAAPSRAGSR